jgi:HAD superfamily hydrolase (TIGR01490 family)
LNTPAVAAIFDLDDTILTESSGRQIIRYLRHEGRYRQLVTRRYVARLFGETLLFRAGLLDANRVMKLTAQSVKDHPVAEIWALIQKWFDEMVVHTISQPAVERLEWHRDQGHVPVICSASSQFSVLPVAQLLGIDQLVYSEWLDDGHVMTGEIRLPITYGAGKVYWLRRWAEAHEVDLRGSYFYSDHSSDLPLLELVAHPMAVNPNGRLEKIARERGWPVLNWRTQVVTRDL